MVLVLYATKQTKFPGSSPELLVTLCYDDSAGKLRIGIDKGSCLTIDGKAYGELGSFQFEIIEVSVVTW